MTETSHVPHHHRAASRQPAGLADGPYADASTADVAELAAETIRYLTNAAGLGRHHRPTPPSPPSPPASPPPPTGYPGS